MSTVTDFEFRCERALERLGPDMEGGELPIFKLSDCPDCLCYEECKTDGYLDDLIRRHGLSVQKQINWDSLRKKYARYARPSKLKKWEWYRHKSVGMVDYQVVKSAPDMSEIKAILAECQLSIPAEQILWATRNFYIYRAFWERNIDPGNLKREIPGVISPLQKIARTLEKLNGRRRTHGELEDEHTWSVIQGSTHVNLERFQIMTNQLLSDIAEYQKQADQITSDFEKLLSAESNNLSDYPLEWYVWTLAKIYAESTKSKPTISCNDNCPSLFLQFVHACVTNLAEK